MDAALRQVGMRPCRGHSRGFTLVELAVTILLFGLVIGFSIPAFRAINSTHQVQGVAERLAGEIRLGREKAMATNREQLFHCWSSSNAWHIHDTTTWELFGPYPMPKGVTLVSDNAFTMTKDGRSSISDSIIFTDERGYRDTVRVLVSGLVLVR